MEMNKKNSKKFSKKKKIYKKNNNPNKLKFHNVLFYTEFKVLHRKWGISYNSYLLKIKNSNNIEN